jgi:hypothetical protein
MVVPLPPGKNPFAVKINNNNNSIWQFDRLLFLETGTFLM